MKAGDRNMLGGDCPDRQGVDDLLFHEYARKANERLQEGERLNGRESADRASTVHITLRWRYGAAARVWRIPRKPLITGSYGTRIYFAWLGRLMVRVQWGGR